MVRAIEIEITEEEYRDKLDEIYGTVEIWGMTFDSGRALQELDPVAFRCGMADEPIRYKCGECDDEFDEESDAEECCTEECKHCGKRFEDVETHEPHCPDNEEVAQ